MLATINQSTYPAFERPTLQAMRTWRFEPGTRDGVPTTMHVIVPVEYVMQHEVAGP